MDKYTLESIEFEKLKSKLTDKDKKLLVKNIEKHYLDEFKKNLRYWMSIYDLLEGVKQQARNKETISFLTMNKEVVELYKLIKKSKLKVILGEDFLKAIKSGDKYV